MAITVRSLLARVAPFRPDLDAEMSMFGLRDALARIASEALILRQTETPENVNAGTYSIDYTAKNSVRTVRITDVFAISTYTIREQAGIDTAMSYQGTWNAATNTPALATPGAGNVGYYYIVSVAGTHSGTTYIVGDIVYSDGTAWSKYKPNESESTGNSIDGFCRLPEYNLPTVQQNTGNFQSVRSYLPVGFAQDNGDIYLIAPPRENLIIRVTRAVDYSTCVDLDIDTVNLPPDVERPMIAGALEYIYNLPGEGQNPGMAEKYRREFHRGIANIKATAMLGYGGSPFYITGGFAGTGGTR